MNQVITGNLAASCISKLFSPAARLNLTDKHQRPPFIRHLAILCCAVTAAILMASSVAAQAALPSDMQLDILTAELAQAIEKNDHNKVLSIFRQMRGQGIDLPPRFTFVEARSLAELGKNLEARRALERYMKEEGRKGQYYEQAVALYVKVKDLAEVEEKREREVEERRLAAIRKKQLDDELREKQRQQQEEARAAAETKALQICEDLRKRDEEEKATWQRVGQIARINTEWKYAVIAIDNGITLATEPSAATGVHDYLFVFETDRISFKAPPKLTGAEASVTVSYGPFERLNTGDVVYRKPGSRSSSFFSCDPRALYCQKANQLCPEAGRISGRVIRTVK